MAKLELKDTNGFTLLAIDLCFKKIATVLSEKPVRF